MLRNIFHKVSLPIRDDQGVAFITVLIVSTVLSLTAGAFLVQSTQEAGTVQTRIESSQAFYAAESAVEWARYQLRASSWWDIDGWAEEFPVPGKNGMPATTLVDFAYDGARGTIITTANFDGKLRKIMAEVDPIIPDSNSPVFEKAACGCEELRVLGNSGTDSFKSSLGAYDTQTPGSGGHVGSNATIEMNGNSSIQGNLDAIGSLSGGSNNQIVGNVTVGENVNGFHGSIGGTLAEGYNFTSDVCPCNLFDLDTAIAEAQANNNNNQINPSYLSGTNFSIAGQKTTTLTAGTYYLTQFQVNGQAKVLIDGEVIIYLDTDAEVSITGNGLVNSSDNAANLRIYTDTTNQLKVTGNGDFSGMIYAPYSEQLKVSGNGDIFGAIVGKNVKLAGNGDIHFDEDAVEKIDLSPYTPDEIGVELITWQELDVAY